MTDSKDLYTLEHRGERSENYLHAVTPPVFLTSLHTFDKIEDYFASDPLGQDQYAYGRGGNPTASIVEEKICALEHGSKAVVFSSGMAATSSAILAVCPAGSHIICMKDVYQPVKRLIDNYLVPKLNMSVTYIKGVELEKYESAIKDNTALIILESPATFVFTCVDLEEVAKIAKKRGVKTFIDNTYCTPLYQKPLDYGIDIVMHTLTKYCGGHSDIMGGVLVSKDTDLMDYLIGDLRQWLGGVIGPMEAWLVIRGMRTLDVRLKRHEETALTVAKFLENDPRVKRVYYPGLPSHPQYEIHKKQAKGSCGLLSFELNGPEENALKFVNGLKMIYRGCSWGGFESLAYVPIYQCSDEEIEFLGINRGLIRMHCGLEGEENIIADLKQAMDQLE